ncbi:hypothetical protein AB0L10_37085 [Streptomyces flaveolus]|uniref:hypothetical protein n=1 Tax=Streptomyces flaveolus TaxID=67297 RepID=UPI00342C0E3D
MTRLTTFKRLAGTAAAASGAALLLTGVAAPPASAVTIPWGQANFYTGWDLTGTVMPVQATDTTCHTLPQPANSVANFEFHSVEVYFRPDCETGTPNAPGDSWVNATGLHWGNMPYPAISYRVVP